MKTELILLSFLLTLHFFGRARATCPVNQTFDPVTSSCSNNCQQHYYVAQQLANKICVVQTPVLNILRATHDPFTFILIFDKIDSAIFSSASSASQFMNFTWSYGGNVSLISNSEIIINSLDPDNSILEIILTHEEKVTSPATLFIDFKDTSSDSQTSFYFINSRLSFGMLPFSDFSAAQENLLNILTKVDFFIEFAWSSISLINYYPTIYLYGKYYRETFNLYKMNGINFSPMAFEFFRRNDNKIAGIKVPNVLSTILYKKELSSGWDRTRLLLQENPTRDDYKIILNSRFHEFNRSPLLLENLGIEITLILGSIILIVIIEILSFFIFNSENADSTFYTVFNAIRVFLRWNFILVTLIGASPSIIFFSMVQMKAFSIYGSLGHNLIGSIVAIIIFAAYGICFPYFIFSKIRKMRKLKELIIDDLKYSEALTLDFYGILHEHYKPERLVYPMFLFIPMIRAIVLSAVVLFYTSNPIFQNSIMAGLSFVTILLFIRYRPYVKVRYNIMYLGFEILNLVALIVLIILAANQDEINSQTMESLSLVLIIIWIIMPIWTLTFSIYSLLIKLMKCCNRKDTQVVVTNRQRKMSARASIRVGPNKIVPYHEVMNTERRSGVEEKEKTAETMILDTHANSNSRSTFANLYGPSTRAETTTQPQKREEEEKSFIPASRRRLFNILKPT